MVKSKFCVIYITIIFAKEKKNPSRKKESESRQFGVGVKYYERQGLAVPVQPGD